MSGFTWLCQGFPILDENTFDFETWTKKILGVSVTRNKTHEKYKDSLQAERNINQIGKSKVQFSFLQAGNTKNWQWFKDNMIIKDESYDRNFQKYRQGKLTSLTRRYGSDSRFKGIIKKNIDEWDRLYDIKNHFKTASLSFGGLYFLRGNPDLWMSEEYKEVKGKRKTFGFAAIKRKKKIKRELGLIE